MMITDDLNKKGILSYKLLIFYLILLTIVVVAGWFATGYLGERARQEIIKDNESAISLLSTTLTSELIKVEGAVRSMSGAPWIAPALISRKDHDIMNANSVLDRYRSGMDASYTYIMDSNGVVIASSNRNDPKSLVGNSYQFRPYFTQAIKGSPGRYFARGVTTLTRGFYASHPVRDNNGSILGVAVIKKDLDEIETLMNHYHYCFFIDRHGIIFLSGEKEMLLKSLWPVSQEIERALRASKQFGEKPFEAVMPQEVTDGMTVTLSGTNYHVSRTIVDPEGWSIVLMAPTDRILIYKSVGVIVTLLICTFVIIPLIISYKTARSAEMVRESEERFRRLADSTFEGILIHDNGEVMDFNQAILKMLDYEQNEVIGTSVMDYIAPESREIALDHLQTGDENPYEVVMLKKDGTARMMEVAGRSISYKGKTARVVALRDVTERKHAEEALRESEERYRIIMESVNLGVSLIDNNHKIIMTNLFFAELFKKPTTDFVGKYCFMEFEKREAICPHCPGVLTMASGKPAEVETEGVRDDGSRFNVLLRTVPTFTSDGTVSGFIEVIEDITERKRLEEEIQALSITDQLTGLFNRRGFLAFAEQQLKISGRTKKEFLLLFIDLDGMKWINDTLGHKKGDEALIETTDILKTVLRESDIIARVGGDEFAVLALGASTEHQDIIRNRLHYCIDTANSRENRDYTISLSMGVACYDPENPCSIDELMAEADQLMYEEKKRKNAGRE